MQQQQPDKLARKIGLPLLTFYGLGTILGAGIYVLVGKVAATAGLLTPLAFIVAAIVAGITALSYCHLSINLPRSAGEAYYLRTAFNNKLLSTITGMLVIFTGVISTATLANGFAGYLHSFIAINQSLIIAGVILIMGGMALWGIAESLWLAAAITLVEISGLILVVIVCGDSLNAPADFWQHTFIPGSFIEITAVMGGAFLAFFAFVGFEDMVNVVEEVKDPRHNMSKSIIIALIVSSILYLLVSLVAIFGMPLEELKQSEAPLKDLVQQHNATAAQWIGVISLFAIVNGVLTQMIMGSRMLYGLAENQQMPSSFAKVSNTTKTPVNATLIVIGLTLFFALALPLVTLAETTSFIILSVFTLVNMALWKLQKNEDFEASPGIPFFPIIGALVCLTLLAFQIASLF